MTQAEDGGASDGIRRVSKVPATKSEGDLLRRIASDPSTQVSVDQTTAAAEEEVELSLGLSLNGRLGVDPTRANNKAGLMLLKRSTSSVVDFSSHVDVVAPAEEEATMTCRFPMMRTCSLPSETEDEWRRRKEQQCLRRMEAKRKRSEKQQRSNNPKAPRIRSRENFDEPINNGGGGGGGCTPLPPMPENVGSIGSQGSGSSGVTDDSHAAAQAAHKCSEVRSDESLLKSEKEPIVIHQTTKTAEKSGQLNGAVQIPNRSENSLNSVKGTKEGARDVLENMPSVSTRGDGPNGRRIEGFLYRYKNGEEVGEEVRIVCVCHGSFLTPAEFVKHAGGGDVLHPLRHIVVNPTPIL